MITKELVSDLEKARDRFEWSLYPDTGPMVERRKLPRLRIRGKLKNSAEPILFDPIGAVCFSKTGITFSEHYWVEAAITISLSIEDARDVIAAANDMTWRTIDGVRQPDPYKMAIRACLLDVTRAQTEPATV